MPEETTQEVTATVTKEQFNRDVIEMLKESKRSGYLQLVAVILSFVAMFEEEEREEFKQNLSDLLGL